MDFKLSPRRPYILRAFYDWLLDNDLTPHLIVDVTLPDVMVPIEYAKDGQIVLNIAPRAVHQLELTNDQVSFNARFGGVSRQVYVPMAAVLAIYARENGAGTMFEAEPAYSEQSRLRYQQQSPLQGETKLSAIDSATASTEMDDIGTEKNAEEKPVSTIKGRPNLHIVK